MLFTPDTAVEPMLRPVDVSLPRPAHLSAADVALLRDGLARGEMEHKWMVSLDGDGTLRLFRSWTGFELYRAAVAPAADGGVVTALQVETHPDRYGWSPAEGGEPARFLDVLDGVLGLAMDLAAGFGSYPPYPPGPPPSRSVVRDW